MQVLTCQLMKLKDALFSVSEGRQTSRNWWSICWILYTLLGNYSQSINLNVQRTYQSNRDDEDPLLTDHWHPIPLLTIDYMIVTLAYSNRLKKGLDSITAETQTGFMKNWCISWNIRLILDLLDYADAVILFFGLL